MTLISVLSQQAREEPSAPPPLGEGKGDGVNHSTEMGRFTLTPVSVFTSAGTGRNGVRLRKGLCGNVVVPLARRQVGEGPGVRVSARAAGFVSLARRFMVGFPT